MVQMAVRPAHRRLNVLVQPVERAILDLDSSPDRGLGTEQGDFELVDGVGNRASLGLGKGLVGRLDDEFNGAAFVSCAGLLDRSFSRFFELLQLGHGEFNDPLVRFIQLEAVLKPRISVGKHLALAPGELDRQTQFGFLGAGHGFLPYFMQQCLNFLPLPQGQGSLRPTLFGLVDLAIGRGEGFRERSVSFLATSASNRFFSNCCSAI